MSKVLVADFGTGNLHSVMTAIQVVSSGSEVEASRSARKIRKADRLILPGQGAIGTWMSELQDDEVRQAVNEALRTKPVLGICLGLQALYEHSEEDGGVDGLKVLAGRVERFSAGLIDCGHRIKIPHMGWSIVHQTCQHPLWSGIPQDTRFYFVHSYFTRSDRDSEVAAVADYGLKFTCAAARENLFAVQFHPEKSRQQGLRLLTNFLNWDGEA